MGITKNKNTLFLTVPLLFVTVFFFVNSAESSTVIPQGLKPGDRYHLIFVTSQSTQATDKSIQPYNDFVTNLMPATGLKTPTGETPEARIVGSTRSVSAYNNISPLFNDLSSIPIYNPLGERVADSFFDLWDGAIDNAIKADEFGNVVSGGVFTGTNKDGSISLSSLGPKVRTYGVTTGRISSTSGTWIKSSGLARADYWFPVYGITEELVVVPLPAAVWLFGSGLLGLIGLARRKSRN